MKDNTINKRLLLGCADWPHPEWEGKYFPNDLPEDWQFSFCANDCSCFLISTESLLELDEDELDDCLDQLPEYFRFYIDASGVSVPKKLLNRMQPHLGGIVGGTEDLPSNIPSLMLSAKGHYLNTDGAEVVWKWVLQDETLRELRARLEVAPDSLQGLIIEGEGIDPSRLTEIRMMAEMMGVA